MIYTKGGSKMFWDQVADGRIPCAVAVMKRKKETVEQ